MRRYPEGSDVVRELGEVLGEVDRIAKTQGLLGDRLLPLVARGFDALEEIRQREDRASELLAENATGGS